MDKLKRIMFIPVLVLQLLFIGVSAQASTPVDTQLDANTCAKQKGVWVIVDTPDKTIVTGCAKNPKNGIDALKQLDVKLGQKSGLVCEIQGYPADACAKMADTIKLPDHSGRIGTVNH